MSKPLKEVLIDLSNLALSAIGAYGISLADQRGIGAGFNDKMGNE